MGSGDWNDGMNRVGNQGKGESVWLTWFLIATLSEFASVAERRGEQERASRWRAHTSQLKARPLVPPPTPSAASIRSRRAGVLCPAPPRPNERGERWHRSGNTWFAMAMT